MRADARGATACPATLPIVKPAAGVHTASSKATRHQCIPIDAGSVKLREKTGNFLDRRLQLRSQALRIVRWYLPQRVSVGLARRHDAAPQVSSRAIQPRDGAQPTLPRAALTLPSAAHCGGARPAPFRGHSTRGGSACSAGTHPPATPLALLWAPSMSDEETAARAEVRLPPLPPRPSPSAVGGWLVAERCGVWQAVKNEGNELFKESHPRTR